MVVRDGGEKQVRIRGQQYTIKKHHNVTSYHLTVLRYVKKDKYIKVFLIDLPQKKTISFNDII